MANQIQLPAEIRKRRSSELLLVDLDDTLVHTKEATLWAYKQALDTHVRKPGGWSFQETENLVWGGPLDSTKLDVEPVVLERLRQTKNELLGVLLSSGRCPTNKPLVQAIQHWKSCVVKEPRVVCLVTAASPETTNLHRGTLQGLVDFELTACQKKDPAWWAALGANLPSGVMLIDDQQQVRDLATAVGLQSLSPQDAVMGLLKRRSSYPSP